MVKKAEDSPIYDSQSTPSPRIESFRVPIYNDEIQKYLFNQEFDERDFKWIEI